MTTFETLELAGTNPVCGTCKHCTAIIYGRLQVSFEVASLNETPDCRRYPPILGIFPHVNPLTDFCGEYQARTQEEIDAVAENVKMDTKEGNTIPGMEVQ